MIGLDTNVLVRYFTEDDPTQARRAARLIENQLTSDAPGYVSCIVLVELVWVLLRSYRAPPATVVEIIEGLLASPHIVVEHKSVARRALQAYRDGGGDFADILIAQLNLDAGCESTFTFDRAAAKLSGFRLLNA
jgi:predicted nucleic-acid-binding protein